VVNHSFSWKETLSGPVFKSVNGKLLMNEFTIFMTHGHFDRPLSFSVHPQNQRVTSPTLHQTFIKFGNK